jgi:hypothetical protein
MVRQAPQKERKMLTRVDPSLDRAVVLFQDVIQVRRPPVPTVFVQSAFSFESQDRRRVRAVTVGVDDPRHGMVLPSQWVSSGNGNLRTLSRSKNYSTKMKRFRIRLQLVLRENW